MNTFSPAPLRLASVLAAMAAFLGSMEYVLEEGPCKDWLADERIAFLAGVMVIGGVVFFFRALTRKNPIVDLRAFKNRNFSFGSAFSSPSYAVSMTSVSSSPREAPATRAPILVTISSSSSGDRPGRITSAWRVVSFR